MPPPCQPFGLPFDPPGAPLRGSPGHSGRLPLPSLFGNGRGWQAKRAGAAAPEGVGKKSKWWRRLRPQAASGGNVGKAGQPVGRGGGSRWAAPRAVHGVSLLLSTGREAPAGRAAISTSPLPGGPFRPPLGACSAPQGSRLPFRKSSEYTCLSSGPPEARF